MKAFQKYRTRQFHFYFTFPLRHHPHHHRHHYLFLIYFHSNMNCHNLRHTKKILFFTFVLFFVRQTYILHFIYSQLLFFLCFIVHFPPFCNETEPEKIELKSKKVCMTFLLGQMNENDFQFPFIFLFFSLPLSLVRLCSASLKWFHGGQWPQWMHLDATTFNVRKCMECNRVNERRENCVEIEIFIEETYVRGLCQLNNDKKSVCNCNTNAIHA